MGNQLVKEYDVRGQVATGGPGGVWKVYDAVKKTTARNVSVWVRRAQNGCVLTRRRPSKKKKKKNQILERKNLEQLGKGGKGSGISKRAQDVIYEALKREVGLLIKVRVEPRVERGTGTTTDTSAASVAARGRGATGRLAQCPR